MTRPMHTVAETEVFQRHAAATWSEGGVRVIYFNELDGRIWLQVVYAKAGFDNLPAEFLPKLKAEMAHG